MRKRFSLIVLVAAIPALVLFASCGDDEDDPTIHTYTIALGNDYPPYDVSDLEGLNHDLLTAICAANPEMTCNIVAAPYDACFDTDGDGNAIVGAGLTAGTYDACFAWFITSARTDLGISFSEPYSGGLPVSLIMPAGETAPTGTDLDGATVGFLSGFWNDDVCLGRHYTNFTAEFYGGDTPKDDMLADLADGTIDYAFWDAAAPQDPPTDTQFIGDPVGDCAANGLALAAYGDNAAAIVADFNFGFAAISADGSFEQICDDAETDYGFGDPNCLLD